MANMQRSNLSPSTLPPSLLVDFDAVHTRRSRPNRKTPQASVTSTRQGANHKEFQENSQMATSQHIGGAHTAPTPSTPLDTVKASPAITPISGPSPAKIVFDIVDRGDEGCSRLLPPIHLKTSDGLDWPSEIFVPEDKEQLHPMDDLHSFRVAIPSTGNPDLFGARIRTETNDPRYPIGHLIVFQVDGKPQNRDLVCVQAFVKEQPDPPATVMLRTLSEGSNFYANLLEKLDIEVHTPETSVFMLRRYVCDGEDVRLETVDGKGPVLEISPVLDFIVYAVATPLRPCAWHREMVLLGLEEEQDAA